MFKILFCFMCTMHILTAANLSDFGKSVDFVKEDSSILAENLKGKAVILLFFQSSCGICNKWAPDAISAFQKTHSSTEGFIFIALKTDGGSPKSAKAFFESKKGDTNRWLIGVDKNATLYKKMFNRPSLWNYMLIDPNGETKSKGMFGMFYKKGKTKTWGFQKSAFLENISKFSGEVNFPKQKELTKAAILAELGQFNEALNYCQNAKVETTAKTEFQNNLNSMIESKLQSSLKMLTSEDSSSWDKFQAIQTINSMKNLRIKGVRQAVLQANKAKLSKDISLEERAAKEYARIMSKYDPDSKRSLATTQRYLESLAKNYSGTHFGQLAAKGL